LATWPGCQIRRHDRVADSQIADFLLLQNCNPQCTPDGEQALAFPLCPQLQKHRSSRLKKVSNIPRYVNLLLIPDLSQCNSVPGPDVFQSEFLGSPDTEYDRTLMNRDF